MAGRRGRKKDAEYYDAGLDRLEAMEQFLDLVADGVPEINAAIEVKWTPHQMHLYLQDKTFAEMVIAARDRADGTIEEVLFRAAKDGKQWAVQMWLHNRKPAAWQANTQRIEVKTSSTVKVEAVGAVKEAVLAVLRQVGPQQMQALPAVIDVESYEDDDGPDGD